MAADIVGRAAAVAAVKITSAMIDPSANSPTANASTPTSPSVSNNPYVVKWEESSRLCDCVHLHSFLYDFYLRNVDNFLKCELLLLFFCFSFSFVMTYFFVFLFSAIGIDWSAPASIEFGLDATSNREIAATWGPRRGHLAASIPPGQLSCGELPPRPPSHCPAGAGVCPRHIHLPSALPSRGRENQARAGV